MGKLEEAVQIIKLLFEGGEVDFDGRYYQLEGLEGMPQPVQRPRPPIMIGGGRPAHADAGGARSRHLEFSRPAIRWGEHRGQSRARADA